MRLISFWSIFLMSFGAAAFADEITPITHFHVAQEISRNNGVLVSRPVPLQENIVKIIALNKIQSLEDYTKWLKTNIHYQKDGKIDTWTQPTETLRTKTGDCEDYALLNASVVEVLGYKPHFLALIKNGERAHAICTFKYKDHYLWFDNTKLQKSTMTSLEQLAKSLSNDYGYSSLLEYDLKAKKWDILYSKTKNYARRPSVSPQVSLSSR